ncbi:MAG TPA: class I SAM-dependent methyltransferase [Thermoanaerobaculia bacterium]|nr:class I SAM-dependent methyltransferase [Thermoanaerobaculia bacterium]
MDHSPPIADLQAPARRARPRVPRLHLLELEDQPWLPARVRDGATDFLEAGQHVVGAARLAAPHVRAALEAGGTRQILDLASGGGGPALRLQRRLAAEGLEVEVMLTDRYPNRRAFDHAIRDGDGQVSARAEPIDARRVPAELPGLRTLFNALHHFEPADARAILADAVGARRPIAAFELSERSWVGLLSMLLVPLWVLLLVPTIRPFRWSRVLLTYLVPAIPLVCMWDGLVSQLRSYRVDELLELAESADPEASFAWRAGALRRRPPHGTFLVGVPKPLPAPTEPTSATDAPTRP